ncbi:FUN14 family [Popillia japonica]|uniref:FUN14 family n=1 Tax=Popillia japonica TaxID=7064 RepID=A0AAW1NI85_POPJA
MPLRKPVKNELNKDKIATMKKDTEACLEKVVRDISKTSATKQIVLGVSSGCVTGFLATRIGKVVAIAVGGGIIILQIANDQGYININWDKVNRKVDKVVDKVEEQLTGEGPSWMDKAERYVDRKIDKTEEVIKNKQAKVKHWYSSFMGDSGCQVKELHVFLASFLAGVAIGVAVS